MTITFTIEEIMQTAEKVLHLAKEKKVWAMHGEMGAGKTTFIHAVCESLGVASAITSPTYAIINEYKSKRVGKIYHMDWYRLKDEEEALQAGVEECLFSGNHCFVEWPEKAAALLPPDSLHFSLEVVDEVTRRITIEA